MSLVGLDVSIDSAGVALGANEEYDDDDQREEDHPSVTPPGAAELLFMCDLPTQNISAAALAQQIHMTHSQRSGYSIATDDYATAAGTECSDMLMSPALTSNYSPSSNNSPLSDESDQDGSFERKSMFDKDVLTQNCAIFEQEEEFQDSIMTSKSADKKFFPTEAPQHVDAAEKVYDTAKGVWSWGKGVGIIKPFLGIAEGIAGKAVDMTGNSLEGVDGIVIDKLHELDDNLLNPAIAAIVGIILNAAGKSEDILKPILVPVLKQLKLIKETAENPELTTPAGVTVQ